MGSANPFFTRHARAYAVSEGHARGRDLGRLVDGVGAAPGLSALDVATGTGHTALALAEAGAEVVGLDPTPVMLAEARRLAEARGLRGRVRFVQGLAESLPFPDAAFKIVTCRRAAHHFRDIPAAVREMARVLAPGGRLGIVDLCPEADLAEVVNRLERLRDETHAAALDEAAWRAVVLGAGLEMTVEELTVEESPLQEWLSPVAADGPQAAAVRAALEGLPETVRARITSPDGRSWRKRRLLLCAIHRGNG